MMATNSLNDARSTLTQYNNWVDTARLLSAKEYSDAQALEWQAMKKEACLEQAFSHRLMFTGTTTIRRM